MRNIFAVSATNGTLIDRAIDSEVGWHGNKASTRRSRVHQHGAAETGAFELDGDPKGPRRRAIESDQGH